MAKNIHDIFRNNGLKTQVLAASFKNSQQLLSSASTEWSFYRARRHVIQVLVKNQAIDSAVEAFIHDFEGLTGSGKTMSDC